MHSIAYFTQPRSLTPTPQGNPFGRHPQYLDRVQRRRRRRNRRRRHRDMRRVAFRWEDGRAGDRTPRVSGTGSKFNL